MLRRSKGLAGESPHSLIELKRRLFATTYSKCMRCCKYFGSTKDLTLGRLEDARMEHAIGACDHGRLARAAIDEGELAKGGARPVLG
jgi:hypothetical protein